MVNIHLMIAYLLDKTSGEVDHGSCFLSGEVLNLHASIYYDDCL